VKGGRDPDSDSALDAMTAEELRAFVRDILESLDDEPRSALLDSLIGHAARGSSGWKPSGPSGRVVEEVERFVRGAMQRRVFRPHGWAPRRWSASCSGSAPTSPRPPYS
jgi:hypothetical protein